MMRRARFSLLVTGVVLFASLVALGVDDGVDAGSFVRDGVGARALGMGAAFVALADDLSAAVWNPAGLARIEGVSVGGMYTDKFGQEIDFQSLGAIARVSDFGVGATMVRSSVVSATSVIMPSSKLVRSSGIVWLSRTRR